MYDWKKMKKIIILIPVYNDWESLIKLMDEISDNVEEFKNISFEFSTFRRNMVIQVFN